jgi:hypothetical protein
MIAAQRLLPPLPLLPVLFSIILTLSSCTNDGADGHLSLTIGNQWIGRYRAHTDTGWNYDTLRVVRDTVIDGERWYRLERRSSQSPPSYRPISGMFREDAWLTNRWDGLYEYRTVTDGSSDPVRALYIKNDDIGETSAEEEQWLVPNGKPRPFLAETKGVMVEHWRHIKNRSGEHLCVTVEYRSQFADTGAALSLPWGKGWFAPGVGKVMETWYMLAPDGTQHETGMWELVAFMPRETE